MVQRQFLLEPVGVFDVTGRKIFFKKGLISGNLARKRKMRF
ncbi:MAG: hypothetical protein ACR2O0_03030 [Rhizobiaceae bacterium]